MRQGAAAVTGRLLALILAHILACILATMPGPAQAARAEEPAPADEPVPEEAAHVAPDVLVLRDQAYGADAHQRMDVYMPSRRTRDVGRDPDRARERVSLPVILMVHGGAWRFGDKAAASVVDQKVAHWVVQRGVVFASVNYRMLPLADPLAQADDVARALAHVQDHAAEWGAHAGRVVLMGHSSGAHLVGLLSADPAVVKVQGGRTWLGSVLLDTVALDVPTLMAGRHIALYDRVFGDDAVYWRRASPLQRLTAAAVPMLLVCSSIRADQPCTAAHALAERAATLSVRVQVHEEAQGHGLVNARLGLPGAYTDAVDAFLLSLDPAMKSWFSRRPDHR